MLGYIIIAKNKATKSKKFKVRYAPLFPASQEAEFRSSKSAQETRRSFIAERKEKYLKSQVFVAGITEVSPASFI